MSDSECKLLLNSEEMQGATNLAGETYMSIVINHDTCRSLYTTMHVHLFGKNGHTFGL